jgi:hypothetical protein
MSAKIRSILWQTTSAPTPAGSLTLLVLSQLDVTMPWYYLTFWSPAAVTVVISGVYKTMRTANSHNAGLIPPGKLPFLSFYDRNARGWRTFNTVIPTP